PRVDFDHHRLVVREDEVDANVAAQIRQRVARADRGVDPAAGKWMIERRASTAIRKVPPTADRLRVDGQRARAAAVRDQGAARGDAGDVTLDDNGLRRDGARAFRRAGAVARLTPRAPPIKAMPCG